MNGVLRGRGLETKRKGIVVLGQRSQVCQKIRRDPSRVKLKGQVKHPGPTT